MLLYDKVVAEGTLAITHSVCLVFVVLALGAIAQVSSFRDVSEDAPPGIDFFEPALRHLVHEWPMFSGADIVLPQAMYLASLYFGYLSRPLQTWRLVHMASTSTQQILLWSVSASRNSQLADSANDDSGQAQRLHSIGSAGPCSSWNGKLTSRQTRPKTNIESSPTISTVIR